MSLINSGQISKLLWPGLDAVFGNYLTYPEQWTEIFKSYTSDKFREEDLEMKYLGNADVKPEGQPGQVDSMGMASSYNYIHRVVSNSFVLTKEAIDDNLYATQFPLQAQSLKDSLKSTKNIFGANILNQAFNTAFPTGDGQPICSAVHPIYGGTYSNVLTANDVEMDFSEEAIEAAIIKVQSFPMQSGILAQTMPQKILAPKELQFSVSRLLNSSFRVDTANNDINAIYHGDYIPQGYKINQYLIDPDAFFVLTDAANAFKHFQRTNVTTDVYQDMATKNVMASASERYSFGISNLRGVLGSPGR